MSAGKCLQSECMRARARGALGSHGRLRVLAPGGSRTSLWPPTGAGAGRQSPGHSGAWPGLACLTDQGGAADVAASSRNPGSGKATAPGRSVSLAPCQTSPAVPEARGSSRAAAYKYRALTDCATGAAVPGQLRWWSFRGQWLRTPLLSPASSPHATCHRADCFLSAETAPPSSWVFGQEERRGGGLYIPLGSGRALPGHFWTAAGF